MANAYMELQIKNTTIVVEKDIAMKLFEILSSGEGIYERSYDWEDKMHWVEPVLPEQVALRFIPEGEFGVMKIVGANKIEERRQKERLEREERAARKS